ncbi:transposase [Microbulbifer sp. ZKSA006]
MPSADFLWLVLQHVLPKGFRRVRDYGFLHSNAKRLLQLVQLTLKVILETLKPRNRPSMCCPKYTAPMQFVQVFSRGWLSG